MNEQEALEILQQIQQDYNSIKDPKYRNADLDDLRQKYDTLLSIGNCLKGDRAYLNLKNAISQIIAKMDITSTWRNISERGINKAIPYLTKKRRGEIKIPFDCDYKNSGYKCSINNGYWSVRNYMVMDVIGYFSLLREGGDRMPKNPVPIFEDLESIKRRENELNQQEKTGDLSKTEVTSEGIIESIKGSKLWARFSDGDFKKFTCLNMSSNKILNLIHKTSQVEFKLTFPIRLTEKGKSAKEREYQMNMFSRFFEFGYIDKDVRSDGIVRSREYFVGFNTILGELFAHNLKTVNYDWVANNFYSLPNSAQIFYRKFLIHNDFLNIPINLVNIAEKLDLRDRNITNLIRTIETNALEPLKEFGLILSYKKEEGLHGPKYVIKRQARTQN